jgi:hypothetical protein
VQALCEQCFTQTALPALVCGHFYRYITYGVDVLGTLLAAVLVILYTVYKVLRSILSLLLGGQSTANNSALSGKKQQ